MILSQAARKYRLASVLVALAVLLTGLALITFSLSRPCLPTAAIANNWLYDLDSGKLVVLKQGPQPKNLVWAFVASCGDCADASARFPAYLDRMNSETTPSDGTPPPPKQHAGAFHPGANTPGAQPRQLLLVAKPQQDPAWVSANTDEGRKLVEEALHCDNGATAHACPPPP